MIIEVCIESAESAVMAEKGGADRVELCDNLMEGGTTPSLGMIALTRERTSLDIMVMVRPRGGDFLYNELEFEVMKRDILAVKKIEGVRGVVFGILTPDGRVDRVRNRDLIELARPMEVTFHRAFDMTPDPVQALEDLIELGVDRVLTSGQEPDAHTGRKLIAQLVEQANGRIHILPGAGVKEETVADIVRETGVTEVHVTGKHQVPSGMKYFNPKVFMGIPGAPEYEKTVVDPERIKKIRRIGEEFSTQMPR